MTEKINSNEALTEMALRTLTYIGNNVKFIRKSLLDVKLTKMVEITGVSRDVICRLEALATGVEVVFRLGGWSPRIQSGLHVSRPTQDTARSS